MIPIRDAVPTRTRAGVTLALIAAMAAALAWPAIRHEWFPWCLHAVVLWLFGRTVEDRLGHVRFAALLLACVAATAAALWSIGSGATIPLAAASAIAGIASAYLVMFPRSRVLTLVPVMIGVEMTDAPAWVIAVIWGLVQAVEIWSRAAWSGPKAAVAGAVAVTVGAIAGGVAAAALRRPERMRVEWWDQTGR
jgi:membrane associated rhomboid family serine protease